MNINYISLLTSIFIVSFLLLVVEISPVGCIVSDLPRGLCDLFFFPHFVYSVTLNITSISHLWSDNEKRKWANRFKNSSKVSTGERWTYMQAKLDPLLDGPWVECFLMRPSKWIHTLVLHFLGSQLKKSWWKKMRMSVASLGSWRICKNPLMSNALLEMRKKKVEHPLTLYIYI